MSLSKIKLRFLWNKEFDTIIVKDLWLSLLGNVVLHHEISEPADGR